MKTQKLNCDMEKENIFQMNSTNIHKNVNTIDINQETESVKNDNYLIKFKIHVIYYLSIGLNDYIESTFY